MSAAVLDVAPVAFTPGLHAQDALARHWLAQTTLRLRREVAWLWRERELQGIEGTPGALPPTIDRALAVLDLERYDRDKRAFFERDVAARYLSERLAAAPPAGSDGGFGRVVRVLELSDVECFVLGLALLAAVDGAAMHVIASCANDAARTLPTLALAQRLWDEPDALLRAFDPAHPLFRCGLLAIPDAGHFWQAPLLVPPLVARELVHCDAALPPALVAIAPAAAEPAAA
uniref:hypothetical protein n=1 Tax=Tahibacter caeni TaxID=1453545 RepID=UPI002148778D